MEDRYYRTVKTVQKLLLANPEWQDRYGGYAESILKNVDRLAKMDAAPFKRHGIHLYITTTEAIKPGQIALELRYRGQKIAQIKFNKDGNVSLSIDEALAVTNDRDFDFPHTFNNVSIRSDELAPLFHHFYNRDKPVVRSTDGRKQNEEHRVESLLLDAFTEKHGAEKTLLGIQPVTIAGIRYPFPTPLTASKHSSISYARKGGGIDILVRLKGPRLCVIELKDENNSNEPPEAALEQAVAYATFLHSLLRSKSGNDWRKILGISESEKLHLCAACAMPQLTEEQREHIEGPDVRLNETDVLKLHWISFEEQDHVIKSIDSSLYR